jgi:hypothetical protein
MGSRWLNLLNCALLASAIAGCAGAPTSAPEPPQYLDPVTAAMVTSASSPMVFARAHQDVSANSRQYLTVGAVSINRSGRYEYLLLVYLWSTVDPRLGADRHPGQNLIWLADDRAIRLVRDGRSLNEAGISRPLYAPDHGSGRLAHGSAGLGHGSSGPRIYHTDRQTLLFLSSAKRLRLVLEGDDDARPFDVWTDGRRALAQLAAAGN